MTLASLKGKVVIVDFWAYSCINCQRELPHVEAWYKDYAADGLEVVGVQTPEYAFEHVPSNVAGGRARLGLTFPVALDNSYDTWNAYDNQSWPAAYLIDATGKIRFVSIGEGDYTRRSRSSGSCCWPRIRGSRCRRRPTSPTRPPPTPTCHRRRTSGAERAQYYDGNYYSSDTFAFPTALPAHSYGLSGPWTVGQQSITAGKDAAIRLSYNASYVYLDIGGSGTLTVTSGGATKVIRVSGAPDIYTVASNPAPGNGTVTIKVSPGLTAYSFTFG